MSLYEITTGFVGCSYERCYAWAATETRAAELFAKRFPHREIREIRILLASADAEFITELSDEGFADRE